MNIIEELNASVVHLDLAMQKAENEGGIIPLRVLLAFQDQAESLRGFSETLQDDVFEATQEEPHRCRWLNCRHFAESTARNTEDGHRAGDALTECMALIPWDCPAVRALGDTAKEEAAA